MKAFNALLVFVYAHFVFVSIPRAEDTWTQVFPPIRVRIREVLSEKQS